MLTQSPLPTVGTPEERRLTRLYRTLDQADRHTLLAFAAFLAEGKRPKSLGEPIQEPRSMPRPENETVIGAIRRLSQSYTMLDRSLMLNETSTLVSAHILKGREASEVIDELEMVFERHYQIYLARQEGSHTEPSIPVESDT